MIIAQSFYYSEFLYCVLPQGLYISLFVFIYALLFNCHLFIQNKKMAVLHEFCLFLGMLTYQINHVSHSRTRDKSNIKTNRYKI